MLASQLNLQLFCPQAGKGGMDDEMEVKRKKNREAAKRCRYKKLQQAEDLKQVSKG